MLTFQRVTEKIQVKRLGFVPEKTCAIGMVEKNVVIVEFNATLAAADMDIDRLGAGIGFEVGQEAAFDFRVLLEVGPDGLPACDNRRRHGATARNTR